MIIIIICLSLVLNHFFCDDSVTLCTAHRLVIHSTQPTCHGHYITAAWASTQTHTSCLTGAKMKCSFVTVLQVKEKWRKFGVLTMLLLSRERSHTNWSSVTTHTLSLSLWLSRSLFCTLSYTHTHTHFHIGSCSPCKAVQATFLTGFWQWWTSLTLPSLFPPPPFTRARTHAHSL